MKSLIRSLALLLPIMCAVAPVHAASHAAKYKQTIAIFKHAGASGAFFNNSYAYAVFPTVGAGAIGVGGAYGKGRVYVNGVYVGAVKLEQVSIGLQAGGKAYSEIVFFEDQRALDEFQSGHFEFGGDASVVAVTAGANADAGTNGTSSGSSAGEHDAKTKGAYNKGMVVFTVAKGGLMGAAAVSGQKFSYTPRAAS